MIYKSNTHIIFVLGMHRSGTSAVIRGLQVLGVGLGDKLMPPKQDNKKGFFEDLDINEFNIMLMRELGHDWHSLAPLSVEEITGSIAQRFKIQAMELMRLKIDASPLFGVKDPRITRLLPFWQDVAKSLEAQVS
ncbi:MAG: hypothetical protein DCC43_15140 [Candidatus Brocadia sp.]|nr:MAG: hypothetical protein DCC43_15140 [Candidatus Brocadia sp.]